jgi:hypothetical protein
MMHNERRKEDCQKFDVCFWKKSQTKKIDLLKVNEEVLLGVYSIQSTDGKTDHAICVVGRWIFDSNFKHALPLNKESLTLCSSSNDRKTDFVRVVFAVILRKTRFYLDNEKKGMTTPFTQGV